ncbi:Photosystem II PsbQ [Cinnamomum micranthum f. kanehirae]|uniref:Photosystem II PsbQ n=1 Tax=Cinnamomum micranthum f. kanehirae TaxID=337451 RepID=A0A443N2E4_9MAGN|nr:Photosystem II PsbQ [Cinnamomum micranthum f. kanehirae]
MMDIGSRGSVCRIKKCALDFLSIVDLMDGEEGWDLMRRDIRLKSTFLYCDFNQVISNAAKEEKQPLIDLANKLFQSIEELDYAVQIRCISLTQDRYDDTALVLEEVMSFMP